MAIAPGQMDTMDPVQAEYVIYRFCRACPVVAECGAEAERIRDEIARQRKAHEVPDGVWAGRYWWRGRPRTAPLDQPKHGGCGHNGGVYTHRKLGEMPCVACYAYRTRTSRNGGRTRQEPAA